MISSADMREAVARLERGEAVVFPTDTVYGLGVAVAHRADPRVLFELKRRDAGKPVAWLVDGSDALYRYGRDVPDCARLLVAEGWPGALTVIVKAGEAVPRAYRSQDGTIGLRMPANDVALELIRAVGSPLATTSANVSGSPAACAFSEVDDALLSRVFALADDSQVQIGRASTVVDCSTDDVVVLREGDASSLLSNLGVTSRQAGCESEEGAATRICEHESAGRRPGVRGPDRE